MMDLIKKGIVMLYANQLINGFLFGSGLILAAAFFRVALHMTLLN
jgi:hypothetical protein